MVSKIFHVHPYLGKWSNLTIIFFQMGWFNHQLKLPFCSWTLRFVGFFPTKSRETSLKKVVALKTAEGVLLLRWTLDRKVAAEVSGGFGHLSSEEQREPIRWLFGCFEWWSHKGFFFHQRKIRNDSWGKGTKHEKTNMQLWKMCSFQGFCWGFILECSPPVIPWKQTGVMTSFPGDVWLWHFVGGFLHPEVAARTSKVLGNAERSLMLHIWIRRSAFIPESSKLLQSYLGED